jgi:hypothetical protein
VHSKPSKALRKGSAAKGLGLCHSSVPQTSLVAVSHTAAPSLQVATELNRQTKLKCEPKLCFNKCRLQNETGAAALGERASKRTGEVRGGRGGGEGGERGRGGGGGRWGRGRRRMCSSSRNAAEPSADGKWMGKDGNAGSANKNACMRG